MDLPQTQQFDADAVAIAGTGDGGFVLAVIGGGGSFAQFATVAPGQSPQDAGWLDCSSVACPATAMAFVPDGTGSPTLVAGYQPAGFGGASALPSAMACWTPFSISQPADSVLLENSGALTNLSAALSPQGQVGVVLTDIANAQILDGFGDASGGCPMSLSLVTNLGQQGGLGVAMVSTEEPPSSGAAYVIGEAVGNANTFQEELGLKIEPDGGLVQSAEFGAENTPQYSPLAMVSDGVTVTAVTTDTIVGVQLFTYSVPDFHGLYDGGVIAPQPNAAVPAAASCGADCTLSAWTYMDDAGETYPAWATTDAVGCGAGAVLPPIATDGGALDVAFVAVATQPGVAAIAIAYTTSSPTCGISTCIYDTRVYVSFCTP